VTELTGFLEKGRLDLFIIVGLMGALVWVVKQWRAAEKAKDDLHEARRTDVMRVVELATEVKNSVETLVELIKGDRRSR
jgi:hypothetical protein